MRPPAKGCSGQAQPVRSRSRSAGWPRARRRCAATARRPRSAAHDLEPELRRASAAASPVRIAWAKSASSRLSGSAALDARNDDVAAAVGQLVLAEVRRRREVHAAVEDADGLVGGGVVVLDHPLAADDDHLAHLARREPRDLDVGRRAAGERQREERGLGHAVLEHAARRTRRPATTGCSSQYSRIDRSCGARSQMTPSGWYLPRFIRDDVTKYTSPSTSRVDQVADLVDRRAVEERVPGHQRQAAALGDARQVAARRRTSWPAASRRARACRRSSAALDDRVVRARRRRDEHGVDRRRRPGRRRGRPNTGYAGHARARTRRARSGSRSHSPASSNSGRSMTLRTRLGPQ